ncbi:MAG: DNA methyltransferase, partial [Rhabdochlamydiaceae bacterium]
HRLPPETKQAIIKLAGQKIENARVQAAKDIEYEIQSEARRQELEKLGKTRALPENIRIFQGDFCEVLRREVPDGTAALIFTDPPYTRKFLDAGGWDKLAVEAERILIPGGYLATYAPQYCYSQVFHALEARLEHYHPAGILHAGHQTLMWSKDMKICWKPIQIFSKGRGRKHLQMFDFLQGEVGDKGLYEWAQSVSEARYFIEKLTKRGELVVEPFLGSGTTLRAVHELHRRGVGVELDAKRCKLAKGFVLDDTELD